MELHLTLIARERAAPLRTELVAILPADSPGCAIAAEFERFLGVTGITVEGLPLEHLTAGVPPLRSGATLLHGGALSGTRAAPEPRLAFAVRSGPAAGSVFPLTQGVHSIGRSDGDAGGTQSIALPDPELSRSHARLQVTDTSVHLVDARSRNGTSVDGQRVGHMKIRSGQVIRIGCSTASLEVPGDSVLHPSAGRAHGETLRISHPARPRPRLALLAMAVVPLVLGVGLAVATGQWMFLAMSSVTAVAALLPLAEGRSARRAFAELLRETVEHDLLRRRRAAPDAYDLSTGGAPAVGGSASEETVFLRLGTGALPADVTVQPPESCPAPMHRAAPVTVPLSGLITVRGPRRSVEALVRFCLLQLSAVPAASAMTVVLVGGPSELRLAARFLPRVRVVSDAESRDPEGMRTSLASNATGCVLVLGGGPGLASRQIVAAALELGVPVVDAGGAHDATRVEIRLDETRAQLRVGGAVTDFVPDLVPPRAFEAASRRLGSTAPTDDGGALPERCRLDGVIGLTESEIARAWSNGPGGADELCVPLGVQRSGPLCVELVADGPHLLIAGTTGSGKSELLRSLVASAAASHSPRRLTFLFVDFKGGSGLEPLARLPHCVGLVSDLSGQVDRTLISLRAELVRRESLLAETKCSDLSDYEGLPGDHEPLPRLVIVVDEFRMLVEESPDALGELLRVASIGRSLGVHLVMATQRPQGAVSADIRANVGSVIALRMAGESESRDVIGSPAAARLSSASPGRALFSAGGAEPVEFQTASLSLGGHGAARQGIHLVTAAEWLTGGARLTDGGPSLTPSEAAAGFVEAAQRAWRSAGGVPPRRPMADPLPVSAGRAERTQGPALPLGLADLPHEQRTDLLTWDPEADGHLAFIGDPASGAPGALAAAGAQLTVAEPKRYLYLLDADGSLAPLQSHPRTGAYAPLGEPRRAARVIARLAEETAARTVHRADAEDPAGFTPGIPQPGKTAPAGGQRPEPPTLVLVVSGWGSWIASLRSGGRAWAEEALLDILRNGPSGRIVLAVAGSRELVASRAFAELPSRLFFPAGTTEEARLGWPRVSVRTANRRRAIASGLFVVRRAATDDRVTGRGSDGRGVADHAVIVQCFEPPPQDPPDRAAPTVSASTALESRGSSSRAPAESTDHWGRPPFRITPLPTVVLAERVVGMPRAAGSRPQLTVGLQGADGAPRLDADEGAHTGDHAPLSLPFSPGDVLLVLGSPGSGKSALLEALPSMNPELSRWYRSQAPGSWSAVAAAAMDDAAAGACPILLVDDADRLTATENSRLVEALGAGAAIVATAGYSSGLYSKCPLSLHARPARTGLAIGPRAPSDGDAFGVRLDPPERAVPGRALAVVDGTPVDVQLGWLGPGRATPKGSCAPNAAWPRRPAS